MSQPHSWRKTSQPLAPSRQQPLPAGQYDIYPSFPLGSGLIQSGYQSLAEVLAGHSQIVIDGYGGVFWDRLQAQLNEAFAALGQRVAWHPVTAALRPAAEIEAMLAPFLGDDPIFGTRYTGELADFFRPEAWGQLQPDPTADINILFGCGAALAGWNGPLVYVDLPKIEIQYRSRAGAICNLGAAEPDSPGRMYKRFYFVDWVVLNRHKATLLPEVDYVIDEQRPSEPAWMAGDELRGGLTEMSVNYFRPRPWFEPGVWGGHWVEENIPRVARDVPNYAWSFEFISPENGVTFESNGLLLEVSFDMLMYQAYRAVVGAAAERFGYEFPVRFNFLDTMRGGELAIQCHPRPAYIRDHYGERFTQDESYYILDCEPGSRVYLGFQEDIDPVQFRQALETSWERKEPIPIEQYIHVEPTHKHDYFLLPSATVHAAGRNNLVLEISATPYIFTFKLYDYLVRDLNGAYRVPQIEPGFHNLNFDHKGDRIREELISRPYLLAEGEDWQRYHFPTHPEHFYDVHRFDFATQFETETGDSFNLMSLVEGESIVLETANGRRQRFNYAETFVVPAAAGRYRLINDGAIPAKVIMAFMKPDRSQRDVQ